MRKGALQVFTKPFDDQALLDAIHEALLIDRQRRLEELELRELQERFAVLTVRERDPRVGFAKGTTQPDGKISRHPNFPVIQAYPEPASGRVLARRICVEK